MITNLSQFKKAMQVGRRFEIVEHFTKPEYTGQIRIVQHSQTNGMYTGIAGQRDAGISLLNNGKGSWIAFGKASDWKFANGVCQQCRNGKPIWTLRVIEE